MMDELLKILKENKDTKYLSLTFYNDKQIIEHNGFTWMEILGALRVTQIRLENEYLLKNSKIGTLIK